MGTSAFIWVIIAGFVLIIIYSKFKKKSYRRDYSLGLPVAQKAQQLIKGNQFNEVEELVKQQPLNDITQIVDHLALSLEEDQITGWQEQQESDLSHLVLGVYYLHMAWITRSHKLASEVSSKSAQGFFEFLELSEEQFLSIEEGSAYYPEMSSRSIRLYMSMSDEAQAIIFYSNVTQAHPDFIWPYLHRAEMIQPKWGGELATLQQFHDALPDDFLIQSTVRLKLVSDSMLLEDNYFDDRTEDIREFALESIRAIDEALESQKPASIHRYVLYNYMEAVAGTLNEKELRKKYISLVDGNQTIYPYGLV